MHHEITVTYPPLDNNGLPADQASLDMLRGIEDEFNARWGSGVILVGHTTCRGVRTFHVYSDSEDQNVTDLIQVWVRARNLSSDSHPDPAWRKVRHFTN